MAAYLIADLDVTDPARMDEYRKAVAPVLQQFGARLLAGRGRFEVLEGSWNPKSALIFEFPSYERLKEWYDSAACRERKALRQRATRSNIVIVDGEQGA
jgi:uncharacterized protein (DUF1330 family)